MMHKHLLLLSLLLILKRGGRPFSLPFLLTGWNAVMMAGAGAGILVHELILGTKAIHSGLGFQEPP